MIGETVLETFTIYDHPSDVPDAWLVRRWLILRGHPEPVPTLDAWRSDTLEGARAAIPQGLTCFAREPGDDPCVVETWL